MSPEPSSLELILDRILDAQIEIAERLNRLESRSQSLEHRQEAFIQEMAAQQHSEPNENLIHKADRLTRVLASGKAGRTEPG